MLLTILLAVAALADPTKVNIKAQLVDDDGDKIELIYRHKAGDLQCNKVDWKALDNMPPSGSMFGPINQTWCVANVHIMAGSSSVTKGPYYNYPREFFGGSLLSESDIHTIKKSADGHVTFSAYPSVGTVVLRTDPIGGYVYYGEIDSSTLPNPGVMPEIVQVEMSRLPVVRVVTPLKTANQNDRLVSFDADKIVFTNLSDHRTYVVPTDVWKMSQRTGEPAPLPGWTFAGTWIVMPGEYAVNNSIIPDGSVAMISRNGDVVPFDTSEPLMLAMNDKVVISIGPAVE